MLQKGKLARGVGFGLPKSRGNPPYSWWGIFSLYPCPPLRFRQSRKHTALKYTLDSSLLKLFINDFLKNCHKNAFDYAEIKLTDAKLFYIFPSSLQLFFSKLSQEGAEKTKKGHHGLIGRTSALVYCCLMSVNCSECCGFPPRGSTTKQ